MNGETIIFQANEEEKIFSQNENPTANGNDGMVVTEHNDSKTSVTPAEDLLNTYINYIEKETELSAKSAMKVGEVLGTIAFLYEKARCAIDYKGEHLLRRNAIERILKRQFWVSSKHDYQALSESLIRELIWARYLENNTIPKTKIEKVSLIISKYFKVLEQIDKNTKVRKKINLRDWLISVASSEIEETLVSDLFLDQLFAESILGWLKTNFTWGEIAAYDADTDLQLFIGVQRGYLKADEARIRYQLLTRNYPAWMGYSQGLNFDTSDLKEAAEKIEVQLENPIQHSLYRFIQKLTSPIHIFQEIVEKDGKHAKELIKDEKLLEMKVREVAQLRYKEIRKRVNTGIVRSIVYIFLTKVLLALLIEFPLEFFIYNKFNPLSLGINLIIPPFMMFLVGSTTRLPGPSDTERIVLRVKSFAYPSMYVEAVPFPTPTKKDNLLQKIFTVVYTFLFIFIFGGIVYLLRLLNFNLVSIGIFFVFLSLVLLFGFRIRFTASELKTSGVKEGLISHLFTTLTLPFLNLGVWLSKSLAKLNILLVFLDFLIEAPLKTIIEIVEEWTAFIRERREEVIEVPAQ